MVISTDVFEIEPKEFPISSYAYLRYFYYSSLICIGMQDFRLAIDHLNMVILTPASALSTVVVHAIKKAKIVDLIEFGTSYEIPR